MTRKEHIEQAVVIALTVIIVTGLWVGALAMGVW
jgi:hypothetical protein